MQTGQFGKSFAEKLLAASASSTDKFLTDADYQQAANLLGIEMAIVRAIVEVESSGRGFLKDGRPKILFERHIFYHETKGAHANLHPDICNAKSGGYLGNEAEWKRLEVALRLDRKAALMSASWGLGQIMGFNHEIVGYANVDDFVQAMHNSEAKQLAAMMTFLKANHLIPALRNRDWKTIARFYNGEGGVGVYDIKLAKAYSRYA
ncbi:MAG: N-acetylmuramidase family protein [Oscillatoriophycideae cyanobacterium NC_groundwater_1537_Pr4_S-0.65um_50_18]|nr:N-acetylmuramidase family protein [Oscillatoriophycideae cyanobacterium NC_groundwater_1537_Pr4_S-0.65um_50_18]